MEVRRSWVEGDAGSRGCGMGDMRKRMVQVRGHIKRGLIAGCSLR